MTGISRINTIYEIRIPAGTTVYEEPVEYQGGIYLGGMDKKQVFILEPWKGGEVLNKISIKLKKLKDLIKCLMKWKKQ